MSFRKFAVACMCMMLAVGAAGCSPKGGSSSSADGSSKGGGDQKITYWVSMNPNVTPVAQNYGEIEYFKKLQEKTGVGMEFLHPPVGQEGEQFKLLMASRKDLPDVVQAIWLNDYPGGPEKAIKDGIIIPLNDYLDLAPNYKAAMEANPEVFKQCKTDEGTIYGFQGINQGNIRCFSGLVLREDWLKELGLEPPETIDEWETVLRAFKEQKGVEIPLSTGSAELSSTNLFNTAYEVGNGFYLDDNAAVQYGPIQPAYKDYLTTLNRWYSEGLLDPDFASIDGKIIDSNIINGKTGATFAYIGSGIGTWYKAATEEGYALVGVPNPVMNKGDEGKFLSAYTNSIAGPAAAITTSAENVEEIVKMFDYLYTEEGAYLKNFGEEGVTYNMEGGKPIYTDLILNNPDGLSIGQAMGKYFQANYGAPGICEMTDYQDQYYQLEAQKKAKVAFNKYAENAGKHVLPPITATSDEAKDLATIMTEINTYRDEMFVAFVTGAEPLDNFDQYVEQIKQFGIDRAIEIKKAGLERYNAR